MPELSRTRSASRSAFLELREELQLVHNGYEFLDEKRILLAAELLRQRDAYRAARDAFLALAARAAEALVEAAADQGLDGLQVHPVADGSEARLHLTQRPYVGQVLLQARLDSADAFASPAGASRQVRSCAELYRQLVMAGAPLAAIATNLERLIHEYRRTERRVRALENVVLPEIREDLALMEEHLDLNDQEEVIRVRSLRAAATG